jgi:hypothetical protein
MSGTDPFLYVPYQEISLQFGNDNQSTEGMLHALWIQIEFEMEVDPEAQGNISKIFQQHPLTEHSIRNVLSPFLSAFLDFPVYDVWPREGLLQTENCTQTVAHIPSEFLQNLPAQWEWNLDDILNFSRIPDTDFHDPASALTRMRRQRLLSMQRPSGWNHALADCKTLFEKNPVQYKQLMIRQLAQSLYVTSHAIKSLESSVFAFPKIAELLNQFIDSEKGHDVFILKSLSALNVTKFQAEARVESEIKILMNLLEYASSQHLLSFCALLEGFEGISYTPSHAPSVVMLKQITENRKVAEGVQHHLEINKNQSHSSVFLQFIKDSPAVSTEEVIFACRLAELAEHLKITAFDRIQRSTGCA